MHATPFESGSGRISLPARPESEAEVRRRCDLSRESSTPKIPAGDFRDYAKIYLMIIE
jgi:hypothetical protein